MVVNDGMPLLMDPLVMLCSTLEGGNLNPAQPADCGWLNDFAMGNPNKPVNHVRGVERSLWGRGVSNKISRCPVRLRT